MISRDRSDHTRDHSLLRDQPLNRWRDERNNRNDHISGYSVPKLACDHPDLESHSHLPMSTKKRTLCGLCEGKIMNIQVLLYQKPGILNCSYGILVAHCSLICIKSVTVSIR